MLSLFKQPTYTVQNFVPYIQNNRSFRFRDYCNSTHHVLHGKFLLKNKIFKYTYDHTKLYIYLQSTSCLNSAINWHKIDS